MSRPRVLFLAPVPDFKGGAERSLMDLIGNPAIEPIMVVPAEGPLSERATELDIEWEVLDFGVIKNIRRPFRFSDGLETIACLIRVARKAVEIARRRKAALLHSNGMKAHAIALTARRLGGPPTVVHIRDIADTRSERLVWKLFQLLSDQTIIISRACWPRPTLPRNTHVVYNGFRLPPEEKKKPSGNRLILGFVGRIHPAKGLHWLLSAIALARSRGCELELLVRGAFAKETPNYAQEIEDQITALGLSDIVHFEGFVSEPERIYERMDIVCVPSLMPEPLGRAVMEAMGRGLVVIASPSGGIPEILVDGESGFLIDKREDFANLLLRLQNDPALRATVGRQAREHCGTTLAMERLYQGVQAVYASALRSPI